MVIIFSFKVWLKQNNNCININIIKHLTDKYNNAWLLGVITVIYEKVCEVRNTPTQKKIFYFINYRNKF